MRLVRGSSQSGQSLATIGCGIAVVLFAVVVILVLASGANVQPGYVGVLQTTNNGVDVNQQPLQQGFHPVVPFFNHVESVPIKPQRHSFEKVGTGSKELQNVYIEGGIQYHVEVSQAAKLVINGGVENILTTIFDPAFKDYIKAIVPNYPAAEILANREAIREEVKNKLASKALPYGIVVDDIFITNIDFDKSYTDAIAAKQVAAQKLEQAKIEADTAVAQARGTANAAIEVARGEAEANRLRTSTLTAALIHYLEIQKWNGQLPQVTGNGGVFVSLSPPNSKS